MAGNNSAPSVTFSDVTDSVSLKKDLLRLTELVDTAFGTRGVKTKTATLSDVKDINTNSAVGRNKEDPINTLLERIADLESRVANLEA